MHRGAHFAPQMRWSAGHWHQTVYPLSVECPRPQLAQHVHQNEDRDKQTTDSLILHLRHQHDHETVTLPPQAKTPVHAEELASDCGCCHFGPSPNRLHLQDHTLLSQQSPSHIHVRSTCSVPREECTRRSSHSSLCILMVTMRWRDSCAGWKYWMEGEVGD